MASRCGLINPGVKPAHQELRDKHIENMVQMLIVDRENISGLTVWDWSQASPDEITQYGFDVRGDKAHIITGGYTKPNQICITIKPGDVLSVTVRNIGSHTS